MFPSDQDWLSSVWWLIETIRLHHAINSSAQTVQTTSGQAGDITWPSSYRISAISAICITNRYFFSKRVIDEYEDNDSHSAGAASHVGVGPSRPNLMGFI